ncbi:hypothetical protein B0H14DRAFT_3144818 [Mycena olivaceomarginata]|nr:hypothetical protein B0H14DRAFT_3144818 [Mycena olivaceomarginata]
MLTSNTQALCTSHVLPTRSRVFAPSTVGGDESGVGDDGETRVEVRKGTLVCDRHSGRAGVEQARRRRGWRAAGAHAGHTGDAAQRGCVTNGPGRRLGTSGAGDDERQPMGMPAMVHLALGDMLQPIVMDALGKERCGWCCTSHEGERQRSVEGVWADSAEDGGTAQVGHGGNVARGERSPLALGGVWGQGDWGNAAGAQCIWHGVLMLETVAGAADSHDTKCRLRCSGAGTDGAKETTQQERGSQGEDEGRHPRKPVGGRGSVGEFVAPTHMSAGVFFISRRERLEMGLGVKRHSRPWTRRWKSSCSMVVKIPVVIGNTLEEGVANTERGVSGAEHRRERRPRRAATRGIESLGRSKHVRTYDTVMMAVFTTSSPPSTTAIRRPDPLPRWQSSIRGVGGLGGEGHGQGTGGHGGVGQGPAVYQQYNIYQPEHVTVNNSNARLAAIQASQIVNHCPPPSRMFCGRRDILNKMHHFFASNAGIQNIYVLHGLGGIGKTQIGLKFIQESSSRFSNIFFIDTTTIATIEIGLKNIAVVKDSGNSPQDGLLWLTSNVEEWLLFFDNADDPSINLNIYFPLCNHGNIIITSRNPGVRVYAGSLSLVSDMEEEDAVALLLKSAVQEATTHTKQIAIEIVQALHYLPLAIVQAGAFISKSQDLSNYLALYTKNQAQLLSEKPAQTHDQYAWTVYTTWQMSFDQLKPVAAIAIFSYAIKYTFPPNGPSKEELWEPLEFLSHFLGPTGEWDSLQFSYMTNEVQAYSLMSLDAEKKLFSIHPLVHAWSQTTVCNPERYMFTMGSILGMALSECTEHESQLGSLTICPHVELAVQRDAEVALIFKELYGLIFWEAGKYKQYEKLLEKVLEQQKQLLSDNHPDTLRTMGNLAITYSALGEHQKAKELKSIVLGKQKQLLGDNHPDTLHTMGDLAITYSDLGEHQWAKKLKGIVLETQKQFLGDNHPDTLHTMSDLANIYTGLGEYQQAKELNDVVLEKQKQRLGDNHPDTLHTMGDLANRYSDLGEYQKAKELKGIVLEKQKQLLGDNHPHTLYTMGNLASTYSDLGEHQKAKELKGIVLEKQKQLLGDDHPDTLYTMGNLANTYSALGEYQKAKDLKGIVLEKRKQLLGDNHPHTLPRRASKAKELKGIVLEKQKQLLGDNHPHTLHTMGDLANIYSDLGEHQKAKGLKGIVLEKQKQLLGDNHPHTLRTMGDLANTYSDLGEHQKAKELKGIVLEKQKQLLGDNHPHTLRTMGYYTEPRRFTRLQQSTFTQRHFTA